MGAGPLVGTRCSPPTNCCWRSKVESNDVAEQAAMDKTLPRAPSVPVYSRGR